MIAQGSDSIRGDRGDTIRNVLAVLFCLFATGAAAADTSVISDEVREALRTKGSAQVLIFLRSTGNEVAISSVTSALSASEMEITVRFKHIPAFAGVIRGAALDKLALDGRIQRIDLDTGGSGAMVEGLALIGGGVVRSKGLLGRGVNVAVLDSGIDRSHPDFAGRIIDEQCFCRNSDGSGCCPDGSTSQSGPGSSADDHGHGTNVSGVVAGAGVLAPQGVAPGANIISIKVLDKNNSFNGTSQVLAGMDWLIEKHPAVRIVNMSLLTSAHFSGDCDTSTSFTLAFAAAVNKMRERNTLVFACSGNTGSLTTMGAPACVRNAVSVGAVYDSNYGTYTGFCTDTARTDFVTCFSDSSSTLDLLAPGSRIRSAGRGSTISNYSGTSQAAPHSAGAAAILLEVNPNLTALQIETVLKTTGRPVVDHRNGISFPRIDLAAAVDAVTPKPTNGRRRGVKR